MRYFLFFSLLSILTSPSFSQSISRGTPAKGSLQQAAKLPYRGPGYRYFSPLSYYGLRRAYVHDKVKKTVLQAYQQCHVKLPERRFVLMECSKRRGGSMKPHRTHQNGMSVDFMTPLSKQGKAKRWLDHLGVWH
ncbi:MAG: penicillin-insensitive murein endopeptidase, partial [Bacteroidota bacterium]